tara:strand:+ start:57 stop:404 length:348 start_codon:yes stop_codon:yes gene_type:complete
MKKLLLTFLTILFLIVPPVSSAEKYACAYLFDGEALPISFEREGNYFKKSNGAINPIVFEDKYVIVLSKTYPKMDNLPAETYTTLIDKEKLNFVFVGLVFGNSTAITEGTCRVYE